jgi:hypothetical protein
MASLHNVSYAKFSQLLGGRAAATGAETETSEPCLRQRAAARLIGSGGVTEMPRKVPAFVIA